ncbi:hypothetical protein BRADI_3g26640v3 [Brachypodium distachyon]|uniref:Uncharacterized protein n=1 Tax=Brachypodium distachyon TaxID=15368 RepID=A0A0Q3FBM8_BRADI|nr:hypothetical protein BRADI_3g26640v3 [Brachypodium distachyon]
MFDHVAWKEHVRALGEVHVRGTTIVLSPWTRYHSAEMVQYCHRVRVFTEGLPAHSFTVANARRILPGTYIQAIAKESSWQLDLSYFVIYAWVRDADAIPKRTSLDIPEPPPPGVSSGEGSDGLFELLNDGQIIDLPLPPPMLSHPLLIHLDSILVLPDQALVVDSAGGNEYRFNWARGMEDGTTDF